MGHVEKAEITPFFWFCVGRSDSQKVFQQPPSGQAGHGRDHVLDLPEILALGHAQQFQAISGREVAEIPARLLALNEIAEVGHCELQH